MIPYNWIEEAAERIAPHIRQTPLSYDADNDLYLKWENQQVTGSFKARGAFNKVLSLQDWERQAGLVTASAGNHGQGVALAGQKVGAPVVVFASQHATPAKIEAMRGLGAEVRLVAGGYGEAEQAGLDFARQNGLTWVSPYNDGQVIAGQGTLGREILRQQPALRQATWIIPAGGGGLACGIGAATQLPDDAPRPALLAVSSEASPFLHALYHRGTQADVVEYPSLADGLAGPVEAGSVTIPLARTYLHDFILVSEAEIASAIVYAWQHYDQKIEGSAAVALAAALYQHVTARPAVVILTGGNIQPELFQQLVGG